jgi:RNA polymerase sigma-70 factor (ECF subfamily)
MSGIRRNGRIDGDLLNRVAAGDRHALQHLYLLYQPRLTHFLMRLTHRCDLVDEIINDALFVVWNKAAEFRGDSRPSTWIIGIAYRCALKTLRRPGNRLFHAASIEDQCLSAPDELGAEELREWVALAMQQLPSDQRLTLELAYGQGHSCEEVAEIMDCPVNTVKSRMHHARNKLRRLLPQLDGSVGTTTPPLLEEVLAVT